jgi:hypothetical protein
MPIRRPKSDGRCIHCREKIDKKSKKTADHVFPSSWYPDSTPSGIQRWTAPSCEKCNGESGEKEKQLLVRIALCIDPNKAEAAGLYKRAKASMGIGVVGLDEKEARIRKALKDEVFKDAQIYTGNVKENVIPGLGPHPETPHGQQYEIGISADDFIEVAKKIVRGFEWWLGNARIIEPPLEIDVLTVSVENLPPEVRKLISYFSATHLGPGVRLRRGAAQDGSGAVLYEIIMWDTIPLYCAILPPEADDEKPN